MIRTFLSATFLLLFSTVSYVSAGSRATDEAIFPIEDIAVLSKKVEKFAAEKGARVFLMARTGRPRNELPPGVEYTHVSFAVYSSIKTEDGRTVPGYAVYNLYQREDNPAKSDLTVDFPIDFLAGAKELKVGVLIPLPQLQKRLLSVINSDTYTALHNPEYSAIANPFSDKYQNCTEHVLDVINSAIYQTDDKEQLKLNTREYFQAQTIKVSPMKLLLGSMFLPDIKTSDHKGPIQTATFTTIVDYLGRNDLLGLVTDISLADELAYNDI